MSCTDLHPIPMNVYPLPPFEFEGFDLMALPSLPFERIDELPHLAAIYFIHDSQDGLLYVGSTRCLLSRVCKRHHLYKKFHGMPVVVSWLAATSNTVMHSWENDLIRRFNPIFNIYPVRIDPTKPKPRSRPEIHLEAIKERRENGQANENQAELDRSDYDVHALAA